MATAAGRADMNSQDSRQKKIEKVRVYIHLLSTVSAHSLTFSCFYFTASLAFFPLSLG